MNSKALSKRTWCFETLDERRCMAVASVGWDGPGKGTADLTYYVANAPTGVSKSEVAAAIKTAAEAWSKVAGVQLTESRTPGLENQLDISFRSIDGAGGTLAQAYFPDDVNAARIAGDIQFDSSENWEIGNAKGASAFDLVRVAVHEIGHALGLEHSDHGSAILAPTVSPKEFFTVLDADDVDSILSIYAPATTGTGLNGNGSKPITTPGTSTDPVSNTPKQTPTQTPNRIPSPPVNPLEPSSEWSILEHRTHRFRWYASLGELFRTSVRWRYFG